MARLILANRAGVGGRSEAGGGTEPEGCAPAGGGDGVLRGWLGPARSWNLKTSVPVSSDLARSSAYKVSRSTKQRYSAQPERQASTALANEAFSTRAKLSQSWPRSICWVKVASWQWTQLWGSAMVKDPPTGQSRSPANEPDSTLLVYSAASKVPAWILWVMYARRAWCVGVLGSILEVISRTVRTFDGLG